MELPNLATGHPELPRGGEIDLPRLSKPFLKADFVEAIKTATAV